MADFNKKRNEWLIKSDMELKEKIDNIRRERIKKDIDKQMVSYNEILKASFRFGPLIDILKRAELKKDKKAQFSQFSIFTFIILALLAVLFFAGWIYTQGLVYNVFRNVGIQNDMAPHPTYTYPCIDNQSATCSGNFYSNMTVAADNIFGTLNNDVQSLRVVALVWILSLAVVIIVANSMVKVNPIWFFAYILICFLAIIFSVPIANSYNNIMHTDLYGGILSDMGPVNQLVLNLPVLTLIISVLGGIFLFINLIRTGGEGNLQ